MSGPGATPALREAGAADAPGIARLHAASWRATYRGVLSDAWLDGPAADDRAALWRVRFQAPPPGQHVIVATAPEAGGATVIVGVACLYLDEHPRHGTLLENLHVDAAWRGHGLGGRLLREGARQAQAASPGTALHLSVVQANRPARDFYERMGARWLEAEDWHAPDGHVVACDVMGWARATDLGRGPGPRS